MERVLVVGAGFMGAGIAQVCAQAGIDVTLVDPRQEALDKALAGARSSLDRLAAKGLLKDSVETTMSRITPAGDLSDASQAQWVIEAALESLPLKLELFAELDRLAPPDTPLASNTSSIPITRLAAVTSRPERVLGLHFFGPVPLMGLVEVVSGELTDPQVLSRGADLVRRVGKTPVLVKRDIPGFVMNRVFAAAMSEAVDLVAQGVVSAQDLDTGMRLGYGWAAGPLEIADNAGLDTCALVSKFMRSVGEDRLVAKSDLIERLVDQGRTGRKSGHGFYRYTPEGKRVQE
jgi:3-hydroxybutyryl-CoA dehydrogenase